MMWSHDQPRKQAKNGRQGEEVTSRVGEVFVKLEGGGGGRNSLPVMDIKQCQNIIFGMNWHNELLHIFRLVMRELKEQWNLGVK